MSKSGIRTTFWHKLAGAWRTLLQEGPSGLLRKIHQYVDYHLDSKWRFVYLHFELGKDFSRIPMSQSLAVRIATTADAGRVETELFPEMKGEQAYEKRYFDHLGQNNVRCFVAESDGRLIHYSWVFMDARDSPMRDVPFDQRKLRSGDVYIGPIFTVPGARGFIYPQVLAAIVRYLRECPGAARIVVLVQGKNPAAVSFYKRLGFTEIEGAQRRSVLSLLWKQLNVKP